MTSRYSTLVAGLLLLACFGVATAANLTFQVNMAVQERLGNFDPATDTVLVRGNTAPLTWDGYDLILTTTAPDSVYRITVPFAIDSGNIEYKFVMANRTAGGDRWEGINNRTYALTSEDHTFDVVYFNDQSSSAIMKLEVLFRVDMRVRIAMGRFDPNTDVVVVRGTRRRWSGEAAIISFHRSPARRDSMRIGSDSTICLIRARFSINSWLCMEGTRTMWIGNRFREAGIAR